MEVPNIISMPDYLLRHHKRTIINVVNSEINSGTLQGTFGEEYVQIRAENIRYYGMTFWRLNKYELLADVFLKVAVDTGSKDIYCEMHISMQRGIDIISSKCGYSCFKPEYNCCKLDNYLIPIFHNEDIETCCSDTLKLYDPHWIDEIENRHAYLLADLMGLKVMKLPLYQKSRTSSMICFESMTLQTVKKDPETDRVIAVSEAIVPANTIVVNTECVRQENSQIYIYHECFHYEWHFMFYRLQQMHHNVLSRIPSRFIAAAKADTILRPVRCMEHQAKRGSGCLMIPDSVLLGYMRAYSEQARRCSHHDGHYYHYLVERIAAENNWPRNLVKSRMIQLGHIGARGCLNYIDGRYTQSYAVSTKTAWGKNTSFDIDEGSLYSLYESDENFRALLDSGLFVYIEGHVCVNDERYVKRGPKGLYMTAWANANVDLCCLRFRCVYESISVSEYVFACMYSDEDYNNRYYSLVSGDAKLNEDQGAFYLMALRNILPNRFPDALSYLIKLRGCTLEDLEDRSGVPISTIKLLKSKEQENYKDGTLIALCVGLQLPGLISRRLLELAGFGWRTTKQHLAYGIILDTMFMEPIDKIQDTLEKHGCAKLKIQSKKDKSNAMGA